MMESSELTTEKIIELALNEKDEDSDVRWDYVHILQRRGTAAVFDLITDLCHSDDSDKISLGADVLGGLGAVYSGAETHLPFKEQSLEILLKLTDSKLRESEKSRDVAALQSIIFALGNMADEKGRKKILEFKNHPSEDVRYAVVHGILTIEEDAEIQALIILSADSDEDVRNWATFGLGSQIDVDTKEIRDALFQRLNEVESETGHEIRGEALVGLAKRKDVRVVEPLLKELSGDALGVLPVEAAVEMADKIFCAPLLALKDWWDLNPNLLDEAIKNCCQNQE